MYRIVPEQSSLSGHLETTLFMSHRSRSPPQRTVLAAVLLLALVATAAAAEKKAKKGPKVTIKVFFDVTIGGKEVGERARPR